MRRNSFQSLSVSRKAIFVLFLMFTIVAVIVLYFLVDRSNVHDTVRGIVTTENDDVSDGQNSAASRGFDKFLTNILLIGTNVSGAVTETSTKELESRPADFLLLLSMDHRNKVIRRLFVDSRVMVNVDTDIEKKESRRYVPSYQVTSTAHSNAEAAMLTKELVSALLLDVPIEYVCFFEMSKLAELVDSLGGISVTLTDDYSTIDPRLVAGATVRMDGTLASMFLFPQADGIENTSTMKRQQAFIDRLFSTLKRSLGDQEKLAGFYRDFTFGCLFSNLTKSNMYSIIWSALHYKVEPPVSITIAPDSSPGEGIGMDTSQQFVEQLVDDWFLLRSD